MKPTTSPNNFDDFDASEKSDLRQMAVPTLSAGSHKQELRRSLMQELRRGSDPGAASRGARAPWLARLGYLTYVLGGAALAAVAIALWMYLPRDTRVTRDSHSTTTQQGFTAAVRGGGGGGDDLPDSIQIDRAINSGSFKLDQVITSRFGGRVYLYRLQLSDGRGVLYASDHVMPIDRVHLKYAQELQQRIETDSGKFVERKQQHFVTTNTAETATRLLSTAKLYPYRIDLSDGTSEIYASDREPDLQKRQLHQSELEKSMAQLRGELLKTIAGPNESAVCLIKTTLSDGTIRIYASAEAPRTK